MEEARNSSHENNNQNTGQNNGQNEGPQLNGQIGVQDLFQLMQSFIAAATANPQHQQQATHVPRGPLTRSQALNEFCKRRPPYFRGEPNPVAAES